MRRIRPGVLGTCCVPWTDDDALDEALFRRSIRHLHARGMHDLYIFGTAGEGHAVGEPAFRHVAEVFVEEHVSLGGDPMVGVISMSLQTVVQRIAWLEQLGVRRVQVSLPNWGPVTDAELRMFFREVCDSFPDVEFMHYNLGRAGRIVTPHEYAELAALHPNLTATKYGAGVAEVVCGLMTTAPMLTHFFTELGFLQGATLGDCGLLSSVSSTNPVRAQAYFDAVRGGDAAATAVLFREVSGLMGAIRGSVGWGLQDGAYDKVIATVADPAFPLRLLPPYQASSPHMSAAYRRAVEQNFPGWLPEAPAEAR